MPWWELIADGLVLVAVLLGLYVLALVVRRRVIARNGGTFELSHRVRHSAPPGRGWVLGIGRYTGESLEWFRIFTLSPRPGRRWERFDLEYAAQREPQGIESVSLYSGHLIVRCTTRSGPVDFAMSPEALMGFQAWLEAMPPGSRGVRPGDAPDAL